MTPEESPLRSGTPPQNQSQSDEDFLSFESREGVAESEKSIDEEGFTSYSHHKEREIKFPTVPPNLPKLYQIYLHNINRKAELKAAIEELIFKHIKALRVKCDQETMGIAELNDTDEISREFEISKENYEQRQNELELLARKYKELKILQVEGIMKTDAVMQATIKDFISQNKEIISYYVYENQVSVLCKEKKNLRKGNHRMANSTKKIPKNLMAEEPSLKDVDSLTSKTSEDEQQAKFKYFIRCFQFYRTQEECICFHPADKPIELPSAHSYTGITYQPNEKVYIVYEQYKFGVLTAHQKIERWFEVDSPIIFCDSRDRHLYVGTKDSILRVYEISSELSLKLVKILSCHYNQYSQITHISFSKTSDTVLFVENGNKLCEMNLTTYSSYLLSQLPEQIKQIDVRLIQTENLVYVDYYAFSGTQGKVSLQHNEAMKEKAKIGNLIKFYKYEKRDYVVIDEGLGTFSVLEQK